MKERQPELPQGPLRVGIVAARFNHFVTGQLLEGALDALSRNGIEVDSIHLVWVPGAWELPLAADRLLESGAVDGVIALGAVIRGGTPHFDFVAGECSRGLSQTALKYGKPVTFGVLTTDSLEQAVARAGRDQGNKGFDVAMAFLHMCGVLEKLAKTGQADG